MKNITVGTASSKASLDTNFRNVQDNFVELFGRVTAASQIAIQEAVSSGAKTIHVEAGVIPVVGQITIPADVSLCGDGPNSTIFTAAGDDGDYPDSAVIYKAGSPPVQIAGLLSAVVKGAVDLAFEEAHGLSAGSVILIYNPTDYSFSGARASYRAGEYSTVAEITSPTEVKLESGLWDSYLAANVNVYKCGGYAAGELSGFSVIAPGPGANGGVRALAIDFAHELLVDNIRASGSDNTSMSISKSYKITVRNIDAHQWSESPGFGTQYGLSIGNSQELDISGSFTGWRHGIAQGGGEHFSIPVRGSVVHDFVATNRSGSLAAADWHGNVEHSVYERGRVFGGGLHIAGNNNRISNIDAFGKDMLLIYGREILGCDHIVENVKCWTGIDDPTRGIIDIGGNSSPMTSDTKFGGSFIFKDIFIDAPNHTGSGITIRNRGFTGDQFEFLADNITMAAPNSNSDSVGVVAILTVDGDPCSRASATNITATRSIVTPPLYLSSVDILGGCLVRQDLHAWGVL